MSSAVNQQKMITESLRVHSQVQRVKMSVATKQLIEYTLEHMSQDPLIVGIDKKSNHFIQQGKCSLI